MSAKQILVGLLLGTVLACGNGNPVTSSKFVFQTREGLRIEETITLTDTEQVITLADGTHIIYDYTTGFAVKEGKDGCYVFNFERKSTKTPGKDEFDSMLAGSDNVTLSATEYVVDPSSPVEPSILSETAQQMCANLDIFWMSNLPEGLGQDRQKRGCHRECNAYCSCCPRDCGVRCSIVCDW